MSPYEWFVEPVVRYPFMRDALVAAVILGVSSAVLSCFLVVRRQSLLGDAISHAVLLGVALGWLAAGRFGVFWGALGVGVATGVAIAYVERNSRVRLDAAMGIVFTTAFALGLVVISVARPAGIDLFHVLLGNVLGVTPADLWLTGVSGGLVVVVTVVLFRDLDAWSFDETQARALGVPTAAMHYVFTALLSATIVAALQAVGLVLVIAMLVIPGATALLLAERLARMLPVAACAGLVAGIGGLYGSYHLDVASGPAIVLVAAGLFALAFVLAPRRGLAPRWWRRRTAGRRALEEDLLGAAYRAQAEWDALAEVGQLAGKVGMGVELVRRRLEVLARRGLVALEGDHVRVTAAGEPAAVRLVRAHRVLETYLHRGEGHGLDELHDAADALEHELGEDVIEDLAGALGDPGADPHGHPIPDRSRPLDRIEARTLDALPAGWRGTVLMVADDRDDVLRALVDLGVTPGVAVEVVARTGGGVRARVGDREVVLPESHASRVRLTGRDG